MYKVITYDRFGRRDKEITGLNFDEMSMIYKEYSGKGRPRPTVWIEETNERVFGY